jgi:hydrogenase/urease accessory protein HupE
MRLSIGIAAVVIHSVVWSFHAYGDDNRPVYVEITEVDDFSYTVRTKLPPTVPSVDPPQLELPVDCVPVETRDTDGVSFTYQCGEPLSGRVVSMEYPGPMPRANILMKIILRSGESHTVVRRPDDTVWTIPMAETKSQVARDYTLLGIFHIWEGKDHLLFVLCLLWIAGDLRRILFTITGFTVAHSITLALAAFQIVRLPVPPVEIVIALSVVFLAMEIAKGKRDNLTWNYPIAVSSSFGLLHGLGFAAVLAEIGLPQTELVTGLLFFNVGVEIGQVAFAIAVIISIQILHRVSARLTSGDRFENRLQKIMSYAVGCTAAFWVIERSAGVFGN